MMTNLFINIKNQWENLLPRERQMISIGAGIAVVVLLYVCMWSPLSTTVLNHKVQTVSRQQLLIYMQQASQKIAQLNAQGISIHTEPDRVGLLAAVEQSLITQHLAHYLKQVQQTQTNQISLTFENVPFDALMQWLQSMVVIHSVRVKNLSVNRFDVPGTVNLQMVLQG